MRKKNAISHQALFFTDLIHQLYSTKEQIQYHASRVFLVTKIRGVPLKVVV